MFNKMYQVYSVIRLWMYRRKLGIKKVHNIRLGRNIEISHPQQCSFGNRITLGDSVRVKGKVSVGNNCQIHSYSLLDARDGYISIGDNCSINDYCVLYGMGGLEIGNDVRIATHTVMVSANHIFSDTSKPIRAQGIEKMKIIIHDDVWIAANVCILGGIEIGKGSVIGAGAVVTKSIPPMSVAVGNPAKIIKQR